MKKSQVLFSLLTIILLLILCYNSISTSTYHKTLANTFELPKNNVNIKSSIISYSLLYTNTNIPKIYWGFTEPLSKVKEYNPYNDYWIINQEQSVVVDLYACINSSVGEIYVNDISKIPKDYHSNKLSKVSLYYSTPIYIDLSNEELLLLENLVYNNDAQQLSVSNFHLDDNNLWKLYEIRFHIKGLEGLYYTGANIAKSLDGNYYITDGYSYVYEKIPNKIGEKIDKAFKQDNIVF